MRRQKFHKGRWAVQKERLGHSDWTPPPDVPERECLSDFLPDVLKKAGLKDQGWQQDIAAHWEEIVGEMIAENCRPGAYHNGQLTIYVNHPIWLTEIRTQSQSSILQGLQNMFGKRRIRQLRIELDPDGETG